MPTPVLGTGGTEVSRIHKVAALRYLHSTRDENFKDRLNGRDTDKKGTDAIEQSRHEMIKSLTEMAPKQAEPNS